MEKIFAELKRRNMYRVAAAYAVVAWLLLQIVNNVAPGLNLPNWVAGSFIVLLGLGFPIALLFCWIQESARAEAVPRPRVGALDYVLAGALMVVITLVSYQQLSRTGTQRPAAGAPTAGISIAVLPFANMSGDAGQEFFSDGMTEEITGALAKVPGLTVIGRTSAFEYKGQSRDLRAIGQALGTTHLIEGSVRRAGDRVRISAQLIRADTGAHLWAENFDRELTDVFAIQEDIARAIAASLRLPLGLQQGQTLVSGRTDNLAAYEDYLRAKALFRAREIDQTIAVLEPLVERDAAYAPAWGLLGLAYGFTIGQNPITYTGTIEEARAVMRTAMEKAERAAREAVRLDPNHAGGYAALGHVEANRGNYAVSEDLYRQALALDPSDTEHLERYAGLLSGIGRLQDSLRLRDQLAILDPSVANYRLNHAGILMAVGQYEAAISSLRAIGPEARPQLARVYAAQGRYSEAADVLQLVAPDPREPNMAAAARVLRTAPARASAPETLPQLYATLQFVYAHVGAFDRAMDYYERRLEVGHGVAFGNTMWPVEFAPMRKTERFKNLMRKTGHLAYWRERGWPDLCRPVGADDFVCD